MDRGYGKDDKMTINGTLAFHLCILIACFAKDASGAGQKRGCLSYEPTVVKLTGRVISHTYPGPPEYESIRKGDEPETYWLLALPRPVCVNRQAGRDGDPAQNNVRKIQLVFDTEKAYVTYQHLLWKRVVATGTLYGADNIHHKTRVLLSVHSLARTRRGAPRKRN